ncbi:MAG: large-conductance mechanosensitive channel protein MscL [Bacteroidales bacterium]|nr:large-conductance mechanosensitive channel protein MscL [Bacteroidales bacterium]
MMSIIKEFKTFAMRGNVVDMAIGIVIGGAFTKIVNSLVNDIIMPPLGLLIDGKDFTKFKFILSQAVENENGEIIKQAVSINYGVIINTTVNFLIIAATVFMFIKLMNRMKRKEEAKPTAPAAPPPPSNEEKLLSEIRDLLKK